MSAHGDPTVVLDADLSSVGAARRFVRNALADRTPDEVASDLVLVVSELVTNAIEHGARAPVEVSVRADHGLASVTVTSAGGDGLAGVAHWRAAEPDRLSGRGLGIVRRLADEIDVERTAGAVAITVHRRFAAVDH